MKVAKLGSGPFPLAVYNAISAGIGVSVTGGAPSAGDILVADSDTEAHWEAPGGGAIWVPVMVEDASTGLWYVVVTGDGDAVMTEVF